MVPLFTNIDEVNKLPSEQFIKIFGNVVEHCPAVAICILKNRPFHDINAISVAVYSYLDSLNEHELIKIIQVHPDLAGKLTDLGKLTAESNYEQTTAGLLNLSSEDKHRLNCMNEEYKVKFGFPFIICVRERNNTNDIIRDIENRLKNDKDTELCTALEEVKKISRLRVLALIKQ